MRLAATIVLIAWIVLVLPVWILGMAFAGEFRLLPDWKGNLDFAATVAAMYLPPLLAAAAFLIDPRAAKPREDNAQD
jgi:hypothetical protein